MIGKLLQHQAARDQVGLCLLPGDAELGDHRIVLSLYGGGLSGSRCFLQLRDLGCHAAITRRVRGRGGSDIPRVGHYLGIDGQARRRGAAEEVDPGRAVASVAGGLQAVHGARDIRRQIVQGGKLPADDLVARGDRATERTAGYGNLSALAGQGKPGELGLHGIGRRTELIGIGALDQGAGSAQRDVHRAVGLIVRLNPHDLGQLIDQIVLLILQVVRLLTNREDPGDLLIQTGDLRGQGIDLVDECADLGVILLLHGAQRSRRRIEAVRQILTTLGYHGLRR